MHRIDAAMEVDDSGRPRLREHFPDVLLGHMLGVQLQYSLPELTRRFEFPTHLRHLDLFRQ
jgi:hypothetical protein